MLKYAKRGFTSRNAPCATPCCTMPPTARGTAASVSSVSRSRCAPPSATSRSMMAGKNAWSRMRAAMPDDAIDFLGGGARAGGNRLHAFRRDGEGAPEQCAVQALFAVEVVVEHRLVHAGAAGDAIDA